MILGIIHKSNQMSATILSHLESSGSIISCKEEIIDETVYLNILARCGSSDREYIVNSPQAIANSLDLNFIQQILSINGIKHENAAGDIINREYDVLVFEMSTISVKQKIYGKAAAQIKYIEEDQCKKVADLAKRVIYLMGLDYGMVKIAITGARKTRVLSVNTSPLIREKDIKTLLRKLDRIISNIEGMESQEVKMGADPEFMLANATNGRMIPASQFFPREGTVGCDNIRIPSRQQRPVAELRPKPDYSPLQLLSNLKQALYSASTLSPYRNIKWLAGSQPFGGYSIGGHIHFSNVNLNNHILRALDNYVGLPLFLIENQITAVKRRKKYGFLADYRTKDYGGFEYRTPGSWLVSPEITTAAFCLGKIVASNYLHLTRNCFIAVDAQRAFYEGDQDYLRPLFKDIWADIQNLSMYNSFSEELQFIANMIQNDINWDERVDIRKTWGITNVSRREYKNAKVPINATTSSSINSNPDRASTSATRRPPINSIRNSNPQPSLRTVNSENNNGNNRDRRSGSSIRTSNSGPVFTSTHNFHN
ncbi:MAG: hypothetical protein CVU90_10495 [Firmicutes bacterium HGW-Firmicutes-15]|nr:MAG: hypothetical protein CVU90_10495 [Firmicutes bacterium HGW-Firmicutes-15]